MSRYNLTKEIGTYETDFGKEVKHLHVRIQEGAPALAQLYATRASGLCSPTKYFEPRYLKATFADGRVLKYPVAKEADVKADALILQQAGAVCIDYIGEKWNLILGSAVGAALTYKTAPYTNLVASKSYAVGVADYHSDLGITGLTATQVGYRIPNNDNDALAACQAHGLENANSEGGVCVAKGLLMPRHFIIKAMATDTDGHKGKIARKAIVSSHSALSATAVAIAPCAACLGYQGEIVKGLESLL